MASNLWAYAYVEDLKINLIPSETVVIVTAAGKVEIRSEK